MLASAKPLIMKIVYPVLIIQQNNHLSSNFVIMVDHILIFSEPVGGRVIIVDLNQAIPAN